MVGSASPGWANSNRGHRTPIDQSIGPSIGATVAPSLRLREKAMYNEGFVGAIILGLFAFLLPVLWIGWWLLADLGDRGERDSWRTALRER
jgi:hypothetical protein